MTPLLHRIAAAFAPMRGRGDRVENTVPAKAAAPERGAAPRPQPLEPARLRPSLGGAGACASLAA